MNDKAMNPTHRRWWVMGLVVLALVILAFAWMRFADTPTGAASSRSKMDTAAPTAAPASSTDTPQAETPGILPDAAAQPTTTGERFTMAELNAADAYERGLAHVALSRAEAEWMNRNGVPRGSHVYYETYKDFSLDKLEAMAESGDVNAARVGAIKAFGMARDAFAPDVREAMFPHSWRDLSADEMQERETLVKLAFTSELWQRRRHLLWLGVVHGSSVAAKHMVYTYRNLAGKCYNLAQCDAWALIAWRMGAWNVHAVNAQSEHAELSSAIRSANHIWFEINQARAELGMPPLQLDLRPNYKVWRELETEGGLTPPVYRR